MIEFQPLNLDAEELSPDGRYGRFSISPLARGYGSTIGVSLRRVLLSSIEGTAITYIRLRAINESTNEEQQVLHEFTTIPNVLESVTEIIANLRSLPLRLHGEKVSKITLDVSGYKEVRGSDVRVPPNVEVVDPNSYIATVEKGGHLIVEAGIMRGRGFQTSDNHWPPDLSPEFASLDSFPVGVIPVDSDFQPVTRVAMSVESVRVGRAQDYEKLSLQIWTNGTILPSAALEQALMILLDHYNPIVDAIRQVRASEQELVLFHGRKPEEILIRELDLSTRVQKLLEGRIGIHTLAELLSLPLEVLKKTEGFGEKSTDEVSAIIHKYADLFKRVQR
ncbi:MAG: DNA-directed RNA polymerase subunit alpha [bacterium JZ-2024 1]